MNKHNFAVRRTTERTHNNGTVASIFKMIDTANLTFANSSLTTLNPPTAGLLVMMFQRLDDHAHWWPGARSCSPNVVRLTTLLLEPYLSVTGSLLISKISHCESYVTLEHQQYETHLTLLCIRQKLRR